MQRLHPEQQNSSLGISKALNEEVRMLQDGERTTTAGQRKSITDGTFKKVPNKEASLFTWTRFIISLYYNKVTDDNYIFYTCGFSIQIYHIIYSWLSICLVS